MKTLKRIARGLARTWVWSLCLTLLLAVATWTIGPLLAIAGHTPLVPVSGRLYAVLLLLVLWGLMLFVVRWAARRQERNSEGAEERRRQAQLKEHQQDQLQRAFRQALHTLKSTRLYRGRSHHWRRSLPWYLLIGPSGSGKSSLLKGVGLDLARDERAPTHIDQPPSCDWHFAEQAVLLDTSGRYLEQPDGEVDAHGWRTLLRLLRKRRQRPLNGVLVNLSIDELLQGDDLAVEARAQQVRQRLYELHDELRCDVPIYLVLGKSDQLPGFDAFFEHLSREENQQVLGISFRKEHNGSDGQVLREEFDALLGRLNSQLLMRLHQERDVQRRSQIFDFPHQLSQLGERLGLFVELAFSGSRYQRASHLRGIYLTSAAGSGRTRFLQQLFSQVVFAEANLATLDGGETRRLRGRQRLFAGAALATITGCALLWGTSYSTNLDRLEQLRQLTQQGERQTLGDSAASQLLPILDNRFAATQVFVGDDDLLQRAGLYQGTAVNPTVNAAYRQTLEQRLLPQVAHQLEAQVRADRGQRERLLGSLRAYLMLNLETRRDATFLEQVLAADWARQYPGDSATQDALNGHFHRLLQQAFTPYALDQALVAEARATLRKESLANVVYRLLRDQARELPDYRLARQLDGQAELFLGSDYAIPGLYTRQGYQHYFSTKGLGLVRSILEENWVLGDGATLSEQDLGHLMVELEQLYFRDYAHHWGNAVAQLGLDPIDSTAQGILQLSALTAANSPLVQVLAEVRENTRFDAPAAIEEAASGETRKTAVALKEGLKVVGKQLPDGGRKALQRRFEPLHRLLDEQGAPSADLAASLQALDALQLQLSTMSHAGAPDQAAFDVAKARMSGQPDAISRLRNSALRLPQPVGNWLTLIADDSWQLVLSDAYGYLNRRYHSELYGFYRESLMKRYPFSRRSESDVALADFREFFKAQGLADGFIERYLQAFVSESEGEYQLRRVDGQSLPLSADFLAQMSQTRAIRRSFFAENPNEPLVRFTLEPFTLDYSLSRADFAYGGQQLEYRHGPIVAASFQWPMENASQRTSLVLQEQSGRRVGIERSSGPWSLFRLLDSLQVGHHDGRDVLILKAEISGLQANYLLHSQRSPNPFDASLLRDFQLPVAL